jgi:tetratricopeptide (TPR) repeat protein
MGPGTAAAGDVSPGYRVAFAAGLIVLGAGLAAGFARVAVRDGALPGLAQDPLLEAARSAGAGRKDAARTEYAAAALLNDADDALLLLAGVGLREAGHGADAEAVLRRSLAVRPRAATYAQLGWTVLQRGRVDEAAGLFESALRLDPRQTDALAGMGEVWLSRDRYPDAVASFRAAIVAGRTSGGILNSYGIALALSGDRAGAVKAFEAAARLTPTPDILENLARARAEAGR